jgi:WD40 repeat protein
VSIVLFDLAVGPQNGTSFKGHSDSVYSLAFSPDGKTLVSGSRDNTIKFWDIASGRAKQQANLNRHTGYAVTSVAFNPNGRMVALGDGGGNVILWDVASSRSLGPPFKVFDTDIRHIAFRPDGKTLEALSSEGGITSLDTSLDIDPDSWVARACRIANRNLSQNEWSRFIGRGSYWRTCPSIPPGDGAPADAPATARWTAFWVRSS